MMRHRNGGTSGAGQLQRRHLAVPVLLALVVATFFTVRIAFRDIPLERDEGTYIYMGGYLLEGAVPYLDFFETKPPGLHYTYALLHMIAGGDLAWMHIWTALVIAASTLLLFGLARAWFGPLAALTAAVAYSVLSMSFHASGFTVQSEHFVVFFALSGLLSLDRGLAHRSPVLVMFAGTLICWATSIKQNGVFLAIFSILYCLFAYPVSGPIVDTKRWVLRISGLAIGAIIPLAAFVVIMWVQGSLAECWFWMVEVAGKYYVGQLAPEDPQKLLTIVIARLFQEHPVVWFAAGAGTLLVWAGPWPTWKKTSFVAFLVLSVCTVVPGFRFLGHYFQMLFPALAIGVGVLFDVVTNRTFKERSGPITMLLASVLFIGTLAAHRKQYFDPDHTLVLREAYSTNPFPEARMAADLINARLRPGEGVFVMGFEPQIYVYTGTRSPTRWINPSALLYVHPIADRIRAEVRTALAAASPRFVVWVQHASSWSPPGETDQSFVMEYWEALHRDYEVIGYYEQSPPFVLNVVTGVAAREYIPKGDLFIFVAERRPPSGQDPVENIR